MRTVENPTAPAASIEAARGERKFTFWQRLQLAFAALVIPPLVRLLCCTLRVEFGWEEGSIGSLSNIHPGIFPFWHNCVFPAIWIFRKRKLAVMTSRSLDGEFIARVIQRFGFVPIRGSSSRGGQRALLEMQSFVESGGGAAFTIDGPRGPRHVAKHGPIVLAKATEVGITPFYVALEKRWVFHTWDRFMIPKPFSRAFVGVARLITVPGDANETIMQARFDEMQAALERVTAWAEGRFGRLVD